jgi:uncharacterized protein DUF6484
MRRQILEFDGLAQWASGSPCVGRVVEITTAGEILVDFPGNQSGPIRARMALAGPLEKPDQPVLLVFENGDISLPIVAGVIREANGDPPPARSRDKNELVLEAGKQLTLVCGKSSITLRSDGRVIIKGAEILSRASGTNKIRGSSVAIN